MAQTTTAVASQYRPVLSLFDMIDRIMDKGLVIDVNLSISLVGIEILVIRARIILAGVDTFIRYAAALGLTGPLGIAIDESSD